MALDEGTSFSFRLQPLHEVNMNGWRDRGTVKKTLLSEGVVPCGVNLEAAGYDLAPEANSQGKFYSAATAEFHVLRIFARLESAAE